MRVRIATVASLGKRGEPPEETRRRPTSMGMTIGFVRLYIITTFHIYVLLPSPARLCYDRNMNITLRIPDEIAKRLATTGPDLERRALEALALDEFRLERLTRTELKQVLGLATRGELDAFLVSHGVVGRYGASDLDRDGTDLQRLGL